MSKPRILVAPLDWGLGHATRCMPLIDALQNLGADVMVGGSGGSLALLRDAYPQLQYLDLPAYDVRYTTGPWQIPFLIRQVPRLLEVIRQERRVLKTAIHTYKIDGVIADNRYGLWTEEVPTAFICHQLRISLPKPVSFLEGVLFRFHRSYIRHFDECWVPDWSGPENLSGKLSHTGTSGLNLQYVGALSRFANREARLIPWSYPELEAIQPDIAVVLSGPEPQRSMLEELIVEQARGIARQIWIVQGRASERMVRSLGSLTQISYMNTPDLHRLLKEANVVISRSGYSSLMDYTFLGMQQLILIPTPGQTEQKYLARKWAAARFAYVCTQTGFSLSEALDKLESTAGVSPMESSPRLLEACLSNFLSKVDRKQTP